MKNFWSWATGTPSERARMVRGHLTACSRADLCSLFCLTEVGLHKILDGDDWRPEYSTKEFSTGEER